MRHGSRLRLKFAFDAVLQDLTDALQRLVNALFASGKTHCQRLDGLLFEIVASHQLTLFIGEPAKAVIKVLAACVKAWGDLDAPGLERGRPHLLRSIAFSAPRCAKINALIQRKTAGPGNERFGRVIIFDLLPKRGGRLLHNIARQSLTFGAKAMTYRSNSRSACKNSRMNCSFVIRGRRISR